MDKGLLDYGFFRLACVSPELALADPAANAARIVAAMGEAARAGVRLAVFPEMCLTGYTCADLFFQDHLLAGARKALLDVAAASGEVGIAAVLGLPLAHAGRLYNCAAFVSGGKVLGVVPKCHLPGRGEFYEERWFASGLDLADTETWLGGGVLPFGPGLLFTAANVPGAVFGIEICEDLWAVSPPSAAMALAGASVIVNPSASNELLGKAAYRRALVAQQSARCLAAYAYASAGPGESSTDLVFSGHMCIAENGAVLAEAREFTFETSMAMADVDLGLLAHERLVHASFPKSKRPCAARIVPFVLEAPAGDRRTAVKLMRPLSSTPFVPGDEAERAANCREIFTLQATGLAARLRHAGIARVVIGLSGGLDSTLALLAAAFACDKLGLPRANIACLLMPGFGTTKRTRDNAAALAGHLGAQVRVIPVNDAVSVHFKDIGQDPGVTDVTFENAQARERTQVLMDVANMTGALMVGTGDLSEAALGFCTFGGDHLSMYHVNAGVPKTLVRHVIAWCAEELFSGPAADVLADILATPITPELLPAVKGQDCVQKTEDIIGPYILHDFFLYCLVRRGFTPDKTVFLAETAFAGQYSRDEIITWLRVFYTRFFSQQFKRSSCPDGPKVGSVALSPRGDWRMPSDATAASWLAALEALDSGAG